MSAVDANLQAMWDALGILGFDLDDDPTPAATLISGEQAFRERFMRQVREFREDYDTLLDELPCCGVCQ